MKLPLLLLLAALPSLQAADARGARAINVVVDVSAEGRSTPPPSPTHPVYFRLHVSSYTGIGAIFVAQSPDAVAGLLTAALAKEDFRPAQGTQRSDLVPSAIYGTVQPKIFFKGAAADQAEQFMNENLLMSLMVGDRAATFDDLTVRERLLNEIGRDKRHFIVLTAVAARRSDRGEPVVLWRARSSMNGLHIYFYEAIPMLIAQGAPFFGRATAPRRIDPAFF